MNNTEFATVENQPIPTIFAVAAILITLYGTGLFLHVRIIKFSRKARSLTWKLDISNSIALLIHYGFSIFIHTITYFIKDLYLITGEWFCYTSKVILHSGIMYLTAHSMVISIMKYTAIVHEEKVRVRKDVVMERFFWINILHPIVGVLLCLAQDSDFYVRYGGFETINTCLGDSNMGRDYTLISMCSFTTPSDSSSISHLLFLLRRVFCISGVVLFYASAFNIIDSLFYFRTFAFMRR